MLVPNTQNEKPKFIWVLLIHIVSGLALLYFVSHFPFPTIDFVYENY